jgi:DNA-binding transcriptional ArsR family regulator
MACLAERPRAVGELADALPISRPAVSQHLKVLKDAGLVTDRAAGTRRAETVFEPKVGGHIYDRAVDGSECRWARVLAYEPPDRVVFSWDISPQWQLETDPDNTSEVEITFVAETPRRTRVELEHRNLDRHGPGWQSVSDGVAHDEGWPLYLTRYAALFTEDS